jgi:putative glycosyltransferase (TIGR04348 family)
LRNRVTIATSYSGASCDLLIAMHARRSADAAWLFRARHPDRPLIVALTGTDVYRDIRCSPRAQRSLDLATRLVTLQPLAVRALPRRVRAKARTIYQSAPRRSRPKAPARRPHAGATTFDVCVIGHLRPVKDPLRTAVAARRLPSASRIRVLHMGAALSAAMTRAARAEMRRNPRYQWLGARPRGSVRALLRRARLMVLSSRLEGGANVLSEALAAGVPVLASRIAGNCGVLGSRYPGLFPVGDTAALTQLLWRAEGERAFYNQLVRACARRAHFFDPQRERRAWQALLREVRCEAP